MDPVTARSAIKEVPRRESKLVLHWLELAFKVEGRIDLAGNVGFSNVEKIVELTDTCVSARHVTNMSADMSATQPKMVSVEVLTMSSRHVAYGYVGNMSATCRHYNRHIEKVLDLSRHDLHHFW